MSCDHGGSALDFSLDAHADFGFWFSDARRQAGKQQDRELLGRERPVEIKSLQFIAGVIAQEIGLCAGLDSLGQPPSG